MFQFRFRCACTLVVLAATGCAELPPLTTVDHVDLNRYAGKWHEIARYPNHFERNCANSMAEYEVRAAGRLSVKNSCHCTCGSDKSIQGDARVTDPHTNAKLAVMFYWPFAAKYWIIDLDPDYRWAVVGEPRRRYLWILSRTQEMDDRTYDDIISRLRDKDYDPTRLITTAQDDPSAGS